MLFVYITSYFYYNRLIQILFNTDCKEHTNILLYYI